MQESEAAELTAVVDTDRRRAEEAAAAHGGRPFGDYREIAGLADAAIVAIPTTRHAEVACALLDAGLDVLVEKPIAAGLAEADAMVEAAERRGRILQAGHLERFNPAVLALEARATLPLFFEIHRLSVFSPRSLDVDVILDLMIHDIDIVLHLVGADPEEIRAAGISILSDKVDIANVRLQFGSGCVANLTASRVSVDRVRKLRLFQPRQYLAADYSRQELLVYGVGAGRQIGFERVPISPAEPLKLQFAAFLESVKTRKLPKTSGTAARQSLRVCLAILDKIKEHAQVVSQSLVAGWKP